MANVQIYQLDGVSSNLDNSALLACDITNPDASERATTPKVTRKLSVAELESQVLNDEEYTTELNTTNQTIFGAINEHHSVIGYSYDAYDDTATYSVGDLCIYNNTLYKCTTAITTAEAWNASHWTATSIADEISAKADTATTYTKTEVDNLITPSTTTLTNTPSRTDINNWVNANVTIPRANCVNINFIFENTGTAQPQITHSISLSNGKTIQSLNVLCQNATGDRAFSGTYDNGYLKWNGGLPTGVFRVSGTLIYS